MKKILVFLVFLIFFISCTVAKNFSISENFETLSFDITSGNKIISFPFSRYCGYIINDKKCYFIDCEKSRTSEFGELCYYDLESDKMVYTGIMSGSSFLIIHDYIIVSVPIKEAKGSDIEDVFGLGISEKKYPLDISIYDSYYNKIKDLNFEKYRLNNQEENLYLNIFLDGNYIIIRYGILDSTQMIKICAINLENLDVYYTTERL